MNNIYKALASAAIALLAASCVNEMGNDTTDGMFRKYNLSFEGSTKTELSGTGSTRQVKWTDGDEIKYYTVDKQPNVSTASVTADGSSAFVEIPRGRNDDFINAVYGAGSLTVSSSTSDCMCVVSPAKDDQSYTTFAQAHLCAAFSSDLEDPNLHFHNAVAILKFSSAASISKVVFSGNKGEVITGGSNGSLKITYSGGAISAAPASTGGTSVTVSTAGQESDFYIAILPVNFSEGIIVRGYDASGYLLCERKTSGELNTVNAAGLPIIANLGSIQDWLDNPKPTAVDLGLSVKWASFNLGASTPEGSGDYFSWGETAPKSSYTWSTYAYGQSKNGPFSEYVVDAASGTPDYKTILDLYDDAAHAIWGDAWRMPSKEEIQELRSNCNWQWTTMNGVAGYKVTSKKSGYTGNFIFLPAAGMMSGSKVQNAGTEGDYWSSSLYTAESCSSWSPYFTSSQFSTGDCYRYFGLPVRAVYGEVVPVSEISLNYTYLELLKDGTRQLTATFSPSNVTYKGLTWSSSDESVATVDANGKVTAVALGVATITAHSADNKVLGICEVAVIQKAESIALDRTELDIYVGDDPTTLVPTISPVEHTTKLLSWSSSRTSVATVDENGNVKAVSAGTATIQVQALDGTGLTAKCVVTVFNKHAESITLSKQSITVYKDKTYKLTATVTPSNSNKAVTWTSDNTDIATVDASGTVTGVGVGTTTVTATTKDGSLTASCEVTVYQYVTSITLDRSEVEMYVGDEPVTLRATITPTEYVNSTISWSSSNSYVAKVDSDGVVTAVSKGNATIYAKANDGSGVKGSCTVSVSMHVESVSLDKTELSMFKNRTETLVATIMPSNATNKALIWSSDSPSVAVVDNEGIVTSLMEGSAIITATTEDRGFCAQCRISVITIPQPEVIDLGLNVAWASFNVGASKPEGYGEYFAWGETRPKKYYGFSTYIFNSTGTDNFGDVKLTKYCTDSDWGIVDNKTTLDSEDDAAYINLSGNWRTPTKNDWEELKNECDWAWTTNNSVNGYRITSRINGKSIFLPACGSIWGDRQDSIGNRGEYWSDEVRTQIFGTIRAYYFEIGQDWFHLTDHDRCYGRSVRAVCPVQRIHPESVSLNMTSLSLDIGQTKQLVASVSPGNATDQRVTWSSENSAIVAVDSNGKVTAIKSGTTTVTATTVDGGKTAKCRVTVNQIVESITLDKTSIQMYVGDEPILLRATVLPNSAVNKGLVWTSSNKSVATVDENGKVTAISNGTATITASTKDGSNLTANCKVTVRTHVASVSLGKSEVTINVGNTLTLNATISPLSASDKSVTWFSYDTSIATVNTSGKITAVGPGMTTITVKTVDGNHTASCSVTVQQKAQSITLDKNSLEIYVGDEPITLVATVLPENTSDKSVTWTSSDSSVAAVDADGRVTAVSKGSTNITVRTTDGSNLSTVCVVTVKKYQINGYDYVDLGLRSGLKWATMNVGATQPEEYGDYFAWGETEPYYSGQNPLTWKDGKSSGYYWPSYKWCNGSSTTQIKYNTKSNYGTVDNKTVLDLEDDAAHVNWGGSWRMPTDEEWTELRTNCTWTWTTQNGVNGILVTGANGKSVFLPAAGIWYKSNLDSAGSYGDYWSSSLDAVSSDSACDVYFNSNKVTRNSDWRSMGRSVRPVSE